MDPISLGSNKKCAEVIHVRSPYSFWVRLDDYKNDYRAMLAQLQLDYADSKDTENEPDSLNAQNVTLGSFYCAFNQQLFEWHRCEALAINKSLDSIHIHYIDLGTTDLIPFRCLKHLRDNYKTISKFAIQCSLWQIKPVDSSQEWPTSTVNTFSKLVLNKTCTLTVKRKREQIYDIELTITNISVAEQLIKERCAILDDNAEVRLIQERLNSIIPVQVDRFKHKKLEINLGVEYLVAVPFITSPYCFYAQITGDVFNEFLEFEKELQTYYDDVRLRSEFVLLKKPQLGQMCVAKYAENDQWYRALIKDISESQKHVRVFFVDYGNEEVMQVDGNLLLINEQFKLFPFMAVRCCLDGVKPSPQAVDLQMSEVADFMYETLPEQVLAVFVRKSAMGEFYMVNIKAGEESLSKLLIEKNYALPNVSGSSPKAATVVTASKQRPTSLEVPKPKDYTKKVYPNGELKMVVGEKYEVIVTNVETVNEFYVKLADPETNEKLRKLEQDMNYFYNRKQNLPQPGIRVGEACVFSDYETKSWLRAKIVKIVDKDHCLVILIDSGVMRYVNRAALKEIYDKFLVEPCSIARACLNDLDEMVDEEIDEKLQQMFKDIVSKKKFLVKVVHTKQIDTTIDVDNVDKDDAADMIMTKYALNLFDIELEEGVYKMLVEDMDTSKFSDSFDVNFAFKPRIKSALEETRLNDTLTNAALNETMTSKQPVPVTPTVVQTVAHTVVPPTINDSFKQQAGQKFTKPVNTGRDVLDSITSPFPVHQENLTNLTNVSRTNGTLNGDGHKYAKPVETIQQQTAINQQQPKAALQPEIIKKPEIPAPAVIPKAAAEPVIEKDAKVAPETKIETLPIPSKQPEVHQPPAQAAPIEAEKKPSLFYYPATDLPALFKSRPQPITIFHFESLTNFCAQLIDEYAFLEERLNDFESDCDSILANNSVLRLEDVATTNLALAAKFLDDNMWYRARIIPGTLTEDKKAVKVEFIDFGNSQVTPLESIVYLPQEYAAYKPSAVRCCGVGYIDPKLDPSRLETLLLNGVQSEPMVWQAARFIAAPDSFSSSSSSVLVVIDELLKLIKNVCAKPSDEYFFDPNLYGEPISKQIHLAIDKTVDVRFSSFSAGLKYVYFHIKSMISGLEQLEKDLATETNDSLVSIDLNSSYDQLKLNHIYLIRHENKLRRASLIAIASKQRTLLFELVDYGTRVELISTTNDMAVYVLMPVYFQHPIYAVHCRLQFADSIERLVSKEERPKLMRQVQLAQRIRVIDLPGDINAAQPFIIELLDPSTNVIDATLAQTTARLLSKGILEIESHEIVRGSKVVSLGENKFCLIGNWLYSKIPQSDEIFKDISEKKFPITTVDLWAKFKKFQESLNQHMNSSNCEIVSLAKKGSIVLAKTKSEELITSLKEPYRTLIQTSWSRVRIDLFPKTNRPIDYQTAISGEMRITYIDYGIKHKIEFTSDAEMSSMTFVDYELIEMPVKFKMCPAFNYLVRLNRNDVERKLTEANSRNEFFDPAYLLTTLDSLHSTLADLTFQVDFSYALTNPSSSNDQAVYVADLMTRGENFIDYCIRNGLNRIQKHEFPCFIVHINSSSDFYVQKSDDQTQSLLNNLQINIQAKNASAKLNPLRSLEIGKLCIAPFDQGLYRARIVSYGGNNLRNLSSLHEDLLVDVFYIDYGNSHQLKLKDLREITPDLVDRLPRGFAIRCALDLQPSPVFDEFLFELIERERLAVRCKSRDDNGVYIVDFIDPDTKDTFIDMYKKKISQTDMTTADEDHAISETIGGGGGGDTVDQTYLNETSINTSVRGQLAEVFDTKRQFPVSIEPHAHKVVDEKGDANYSESTLPDLSLSEKPNLNQTNTTEWNVTDPNLRNYDYYEPTKMDDTMASSVVNQTADQTDQSQANPIVDMDKTPIDEKTSTADKTPTGELYETVNETPTKSEEPQTVVAPTKQTPLLTRPAKIDMITIKNCLVSFMHSSEDFFIQMIDVDDRLAKIQPEIDECLDPFVLEESSLCVTQYRVDEQFYRGRVLKWEEDKGEALVLFIDFGNKERCLIDSTTRLSDTLRTVKPLAINCKLKSPIAVNTPAYSQLQTLINEEIVFDVRMKRSDFERFFDASSLETCGEFKCECELVTPRGLVVTVDTLNEPRLWENMSVQQVTDLEQRQNDFDQDIGFIQKIIGEIEFIKQEPQSFRDDAISCSQEAQKHANGQRDEEDEDEDKSGGGRNTEQSSEKPLVEQSASNGDCSSGDNKTTTSMSDGSGDPNKQALTIDVSENQSKTVKKANEETSEEICANPEEYFYKPNGANQAESYPDDEENTLNDLPDLSEISQYKEDVGYSKLGDQSSVYITDAVAYTRTAVNGKTGDVNKSLLIVKTDMERKSSNGDKSEDKLSAAINGQKETTNKEEPAKEQTHPKNEEELNGDDEVFDESVKEDESIVDNSQMHPKNITVDTPLGETSVWHSEKSRIEIEAKEKEIVKDNTAKIEKKVIQIPIEEPKPVDKKRKKPAASAEDTCLDQDSKWEDSIAASSTANESRTNKSVKNTSILNESAMRHGHNETVNRSRFDESQAWDRSLNALDDTRMNHPHNETVNRSRFDASKTWERSALADETTFMNHPHNETVNRSKFDASRTWEGAGLADDTFMNHPHNETVNRSQFDASKTWDRSVLEGAADDTIMNHPHNKTVSPSKFNKTAEWKADKSLQNGETGEAEENDEQNTTMIENNSRSVNYLARTINLGDRANESTWSPDNTVIDTSAKKSSNSIGYQRVLLGYCVNVEKGLDEFYFRLQDADQQLKSIIPTSESELRPLDKLPQCGELFLARAQKKQLCRAQILSCDNRNETVSLLLIDYGLITSVKNSDLFKIDREIKYLPPLALQCRLHLSKEIEHLKVKLSESKRNAVDWLNERFRDLVGPNKLVTLKQVKELNLSTQKPEQQHKICVDLFVNNGKENLCDLLLMEAVNELSRENKIDIKQHQQLPSHSISDTFDCRVLEVAFVANNLQIQLKLQNESVIRKLDSIISSIENMSTLSENDEITPHHSSYLAPLPDHIWANYSYKSHGLKLRKNLARVKIAEKVLNEQLVKVEYEDFGCEATIPVTSLSLINRHFEHIQSAIEIMYLDLDDGEKLPELSEAARKELREILEEICGLASFKAVLVVNESKHKRSVTSHSSSSNNVIRYVKLIDTHRESLDVGKLIDWCLNLMQSPPHSFRGYLTHLDGDFVRFDCLSELSHQSEYIRELKKLYRAEMKREEALETLTYKIGELCLIDCSSSRSKRGAKKPDFTKCESLLSLNEPSAILADETANATAVDEENGEGKADLSRGIIIDMSIDKCVLLNVDDGKKLTVSKKRLFECTKLIYKLPLMLITAKLTHEVDESTQKQLNQSRFYGEPITLTVLGAQNDQKSLSSHERRLYKLVQMPWHQGDKTAEKKDENSVETEPLYYKLCYVKSLTHFYIHTSETMKRLREIEEELEAEHARSKKRPSNTVLVLKKGHVYGNYSSDEKKYYRVRMTDTDEMFFIDYGFMKSSIDKQQHLFEISDWLAQMAPEARCCRLSGFQERETFGELTNTARTNELRTRSQLDLFRRLLEGKPFLASLSQQFAQSNKRISNYIPAQCDNTQPVEIVIHLLNDITDNSGGSEDENNTHSEMRAMLNSSRSAFLDEINTASGDEKTSGGENTRNLTNILKQITATVNNSSGSSAANRRASVPSSNAFGIISRPLKHVDLFADSYTVAHVEVVNIVSPTEFYIRKPNWEILYNQLGEQMRRDLGKSTSGHNVREKDLLQPGLICAYVNRAEETFKRAMVVASNLKNSKHLQVKLFLVDSGKFLTTTDSNLYYFENEQYFNVEPLCFMCSLKLDPAVSISNDLIAKFRKLVSLHKNFRLECVEAAPLASHLPGGFVKYQVEMFTYVNAASSLNQQLNQLSQSNMLDMTSICDSDIFFEPQIEGEKTQEFRESMLPVNQELKAQLTNVDSIRLFGIVLSSQANKRAEFIRSFHAWHREERAHLKPLLTSTENVSPDDLVGRICTVHSVMQAQWSRAIVLSCDFSARTASIYLVDYCKTVGTMIDRLYKLEKPEFLSEPVYAHRCQLEDEPEQRERFSKYLDILKTYHVSGFAPTAAVIGGLTAAPNSPIPSSQQQPQSHIAIENYELTIDCKHKQVSSVDYESNRVRTWLSTVRINDIKRIVSPFKGSPHSILSAKSSRASLLKRQQLQQQQQAASDSFSSMSATMLTATSATNGCAMALGSAGLDESSMMLENVENVLKISDNSTAMSRTAYDYDRVTTTSYASSSNQPPVFNINASSINTPMSYKNANINGVDVNIDNNNDPEESITINAGTSSSNSNEKATNSNSNNQNVTATNDTFSAVTESTRIQNTTSATVDDPLNDFDGDMTTTIMQQQQQSGSKSPQTQKSRTASSRRASDFEEPLVVVSESPCVAAVDADQSNDLIACLNDLEVGGPPIRVFLVASELSMNEFVSLKADLHASFERLQAAMNLHYEKISRASKSLEKDDFNPLSYDAEENGLSDSLGDGEGHKIATSQSLISDPFAHSFKQGEFAAACLNKKWSRCLILDMDRKRAQVECLDDCSTHMVHLSKLEKLLPVFKKLPRFAFRCKLNGWSTEKLMRFDHKRFTEFKDSLIHHESTSLTYCAQVEIIEYKECNFSTLYECRLFLNGVDFIDYFQRK